MQRFACTALIVLFVVGSLFAQENARPALRVFLAQQTRPFYAASGTVNLTVSLENVAPRMSTSTGQLSGDGQASPSDLSTHREIRFGLGNTTCRRHHPHLWTNPN